MVAYADILLPKCAQFRDESQFIDVRLKVDEDIFPAHRIVLAANSDYFHAMFTDEMKESNQEVAELKDESISPHVLKIILDSIYTGHLLVNEENVSKVLAAADHLQVASAVHQCCDFLLTKFVKLRFDFETYCRIWEIASNYGLKDLQDAAECNVAKMYTDVCESKEFLTHIGGNQLSSLLSRDDLSAPSETFILKSVMQWINYEKGERMAVAAKVIGAVRLGLVDMTVALDDLDTEEMQQVPEIHKQVYKAAVYRHKPSHKPKFSADQTKPRSKSPDLVAVSPRSSLQFFDVGTKAWNSVNAPATKATHYYSAVSAGDKLIVAANDSLGYCLYRYDLAANMWERLPQMTEIKHLCVAEEHMYAFPADCRKYPQRYNFAQCRWESILRAGIAFNVKSLFFCCSVAVLNNKVYVLYVEAWRMGHVKSVELHCFDPQKNTWEKKANTTHSHFGSSLLEVNGKLYVAGGKVTSDSSHGPYGQLASVEMYNEETNAWTFVEQLHVPADIKLGAVEIEGRLYFIINQFPYDSGIRLAHGELNRTVLNEWENLAKIDQGAALGYFAVPRLCGV